MILLEWNVGIGASISILLSKTEINDIHLVAMNAGTNQKIGRFDVTVNKVGGVDTLYA